MNLRLTGCLSLLILSLLIRSGTAEPTPGVDPKDELVRKPLKVLLITGGCCHDYTFQTKALQQAAKKHALAIEWTVVNEGGRGTSAKIDLYDDPDWAAGFDVVVHNECFANTKDPEYVQRITAAHHAGANAVVIHCAMHTYRAATIDDWREFLGVTSRRHAVSYTHLRAHET